MPGHQGYRFYLHLGDLGGQNLKLQAYEGNIEVHIMYTALLT